MKEKPTHLYNAFALVRVNLFCAMIFGEVKSNVFVLNVGWSKNWPICVMFGEVKANIYIACIISDKMPAN